MRGYKFIVKDLTDENAELREQVKTLEEDIGLLREEVKLLEETQDLGAGQTGSSVSHNIQTLPVGQWVTTVVPDIPSQQDLVDAKALVAKHEKTIQDLEREVSELESLIESKIYHQDDLENRIADLERDLQRARQAATAAPRNASNATSDQQRSVSGASASSGTSFASSGSVLSSGAETDVRCELCEGPHELDSCPVFQGNLDAVAPPKKGSPLAGKAGKWCADCEVSLGRFASHPRDWADGSNRRLSMTPRSAPWQKTCSDCPLSDMSARSPCVNVPEMKCMFPSLLFCNHMHVPMQAWSNRHVDRTRDVSGFGVYS